MRLDDENRVGYKGDPNKAYRDKLNQLDKKIAKTKAAMFPTMGQIFRPMRRDGKRTASGKKQKAR